MRLTGKHETAPWNKFSYGVAVTALRSAFHAFVRDGYHGYLEDRRPNSQGCPYQIASQVPDDFLKSQPRKTSTGCLISAKRPA